MYVRIRIGASTPGQSEEEKVAQRKRTEKDDAPVVWMDSTLYLVAALHIPSDRTAKSAERIDLSFFLFYQRVTSWEIATNRSILTADRLAEWFSIKRFIAVYAARSWSTRTLFFFPPLSLYLYVTNLIVCRGKAQLYSLLGKRLYNNFHRTWSFVRYLFSSNHRQNTS